MLTNNFATYGLKVLYELGRDLVYFPVWWYSRGLMNFLQGQARFLSGRQKSLALLVWIKNIFKPMYGQTDWQGKLISFFMRLVQIIFRGLLMFIYLMFSLALLVFWLILPPLIMYQIIFQLI